MNATETTTTATLKPLTGLHIVASRWFQRTYGNTYHSVTIYANDQKLVYLPFQYGYGEQWLQTALDWLAMTGYIPTREGDPFTSAEHGTQYLREELHGTYSVIDVQRKKDL